MKQLQVKSSSFMQHNLLWLVFGYTCVCVCFVFQCGCGCMCLCEVCVVWWGDVSVWCGVCGVCAVCVFLMGVFVV